MCVTALVRRWCGGCSKCLTKHGFNVEVAEDGVLAFEKLEAIRERVRAGDRSAHPIDLILLDLVMPRMDGKMVLSRLKDDPEVRVGYGGGGVGSDFFSLARSARHIWHGSVLCVVGVARWRGCCLSRLWHWRHFVLWVLVAVSHGWLVWWLPCGGCAVGKRVRRVAAEWEGHALFSGGFVASVGM